MTIFEILNNLTTQKDTNWINDMNEKDIVPIVIQKWMSMSQKHIKTAAKLSKMTFYLSPKIFLAYTWSITKKSASQDYFNYIKPEKKTNFEIDILDKIKKLLKLSDNDWNASKKYYTEAVMQYPLEIFDMIGADKKLRKKYLT